ncbi:MAG: hypothetical protein ABEJ36_06330 [Candidatus Nanosalina sp.]
MSEEKLLGVDCSEMEDLLPSPETVKSLNKAVTDPVRLIDDRTREDLSNVDVGNDFDVEIGGIPDEAVPELEVSREEDYYQLREEGQLEILLGEIMPHECRENSEGVWLTAVLMSRIAKNQIFGEGNKRTSYLAGALFLRNIQEANRFRNPLIPDLNKYLTRMLSDVAIQNPSETGGKEDRDLERDTEDLYMYLRNGLERYL